MGNKFEWAFHIWLIITLFGMITGCTESIKRITMVEAERVSGKDRVKDNQMQACFVEYCESTENRKEKKAGLKIIELVADAYGVELELDRGFCEGYYVNRRVSNGYRWALHGTYETCHGENRT